MLEGCVRSRRKSGTGKPQVPSREAKVSLQTSDITVKTSDIMDGLRRELKIICWSANGIFTEKKYGPEGKMSTGISSKIGIWATQ